MNNGTRPLHTLKQDVAAALLRRHPGGADVVYEGVGGALREQLLGCLAPEGRLLQVRVSCVLP